MSGNLGIQLTPGQRCLLDLLQRKLLNTVQSYAKLSIERQELGTNDHIETELKRLKDKIRRISARQKRFTLEIINGNGNNTIPKESFFKALGLVTKEALSKLNSKTSERRRRTTANPRFSHEAIQAKRALEPLQKRLEPRVRDRRETTRKPQRQQTAHNAAPITNISTNAKDIDLTNLNNDVTNTGRNNEIKDSDQQATNNTRSSSRSAAPGRDRNLMIHNERRDLILRVGNLQQQINSKVSQIKDKRESNKKLENQNELIRKRGLDIISAMNMIDSGTEFREHDQLPNPLNHSQTDRSGQPGEPLDIWIDMKCDESLDGLD